MHTLQEALDRLDVLIADPIFIDLLLSLKALGVVHQELNVEIDQESRRETPTINGVYTGGYLAGLGFAKKEISAQVYPLHIRVFNLLGFKDTSLQLFKEINNILLQYEDDEYDLEGTLVGFREVITAYFEPVKV